MPKNTQKTTTSNTASYGQIHPESNPYIDRFANFEPQLDPTIGYRAGAAKRQLNNSFINPLGGYSTPQRDEAIRRSAERGIDESAAMQMRAGAYDVNQQKMGQLGSLASLMSPRIVQTGSSGTQNTEAGKNLFGNLLDAGMGAASMAMF
jgi:hypothetical protein